MTTVSAMRQSNRRLRTAITQRVASLACLARLDLALLEERQLLPQKQVLSGQGCTWAHSLEQQSTEVEEGVACSQEAMPESGKEDQRDTQ